MTYDRAMSDNMEERLEIALLLKWIYKELKASPI